MRLLVSNINWPKLPGMCSHGRYKKDYLANPYLRVTEGTATIEASDAYKFVRIPVEADEGETLTEGYLPLRAHEESRRAKKAMTVTDDSATVGDVTFKRPPACEKPFPNWGEHELMLDRPTKPLFAVGINARFLKELADALGSESVVLCFDGEKGVFNPLAPVRVVSGNDYGSEGAAAQGALMPIRIAGQL